MIPEINSLSNEERLNKRGVLSLEIRRLQSDLILVFETIKRFAKVETGKFFQSLEDPCTRGHNLRIIKQTCRLNI